ncbi:gamma-glutamyltransferase [Flavobacteriaceae bacterium Ap0902]|nr:gamma-glutamyltransferase [Flavobacteriaceae bacterium Ap0902]
MKNIVILSLVWLMACVPTQQTQNSNQTSLPDTNSVETNRHAMVVSAREEASKIGVEIMRRGGNAFDAMVATDAALAVCFPFAGNIGGGGFMVYRLKDGTTGTLDYREKAPKAAHEKMYQDKNGELIPRLSMDGALAVGVPGTVAGMYEAHQKLGKLSWKEVMQPAIDLAKNGFVVTEKQAEMLNGSRYLFQKVNKNRKIYFDKAWKEGDVIVQPNLAKTLEQIRDKGRDGFYKGKIAKKTVVFIQENGGIITEEDLLDYNPIWRNPIQFKFHDYEITTMGPPSSGGIVLGQILKTLENYPLNEMQHNSANYIQLITEVERRAYADRSKFLGDPDFVNVPLVQLMDKSYLKQRMEDFNWDKATSSSDIAPGDIEWTESNETTHYSIVDTDGNAVSVTTTINGAYGSKLYDNELGYFFNNEMDDFSAKPGVPNMFGLVGGEANKIEPEKRMLSSMTPTIVSKDDKLHMVLGTPGGSTIITTVLQTILNQTIFNMNMQQAVSAPRFHHQWLPDEVTLEPRGFDPSVIQVLKDKGYNIQEKNNRILGKMDAIRVIEDGSLEGGADPRGDDSAVEL